MSIYPRQTIYWCVYGLALAYALLSLLVPAPARADIGVLPILPGGSSIKPDEDTPIQMAAEVVTMNIRPATEADNTLVELVRGIYTLELYEVWFPAVAEVEAVFTMTNPTREAVSMSVWFPMASTLENNTWSLFPGETVPRIASFQVSVDGNPLEYAVSELPNPKGTDKPPLPWASFPVTFPNEKDTVIQVNYQLPLPESAAGYAMALYYVFQTGAGWAGTITQAELIVNLPYPASEGTIAAIPPGELSLPPLYLPRKLIDLPSNMVMKGNQARWTWKDFEPGPQDDFAIWLLHPSKWQELETARAAVQANPQDGMAWLNLASTYYWLVAVTDDPSIFSDSYEQSCLEAYQKAEELIPEHPAPHAGLGLLALRPYIFNKNAPPEVIQYVEAEFKTAKELEAQNPSWADQASMSSYLLLWLEGGLDQYHFNSATATAHFFLMSTDMARHAPTEGLLATATPTVTQTPTMIPTHTLSPTTTPTTKYTLTAPTTPTQAPPLPPTNLPATPPTNAKTKGSQASLAILAAAVVIVLIIAGYLAWDRRQKSKP